MKNFEKYSSKKLEQYSSPVDTDKLWANIDTQLRPRRKKRWLFLLLLPAAAGIAGTGYYFTGQSLTPAQPMTVSAPEAVSSDATKTPGGVADLELKQSTPAIPVNRPSTTTDAANQDKSETTSNAITTLKYSKPIVYKGNTKSASLESFQTKSLTNTPAVKQEEPAANHTAQSENRPDPVANQQVVPEKLQEQADRQAKQTAKQTEREHQDISPVQPKADYNADQADNATAISRLPHAEPVLLYRKKTKLPKHTSECYDWKSKSFVPFVSVYGGMAYPVRHLELKDVLYTRDYDKRNLTEDVLESWHAGLTLGIEHRSGIAVEGGLHYQQINERFFSSRFLRDTMGSQLVITTIIHGPGDTTKFEEYRPIVRETTTTMTRYNKYRFLSVPVSLRYEWALSRRWQPYLRAGAMINLMAFQKATIFYGDAAQEFNTATKPQPSNYPFKTRVGVDLFGAIGVRASASRQFSLFGEIRYQHPLYEITRSDYPIGQRYRLPGITVGGIYSF